MYRVWNFLTQYSLLLIGGAIAALIWANINADSYHRFVEFVLFDDFIIGKPYVDENGNIARKLTLHYLVNDVLMALFFAIAAKEVWEAIILENGSLRGKKAATPLTAAAGGMLGPITVYLGLAYFLGSETYSAVANGWAIPTATDIAFCYLVGRLVFGAGHPAVRFLLLLAIADDAAGMAAAIAWGGGWRFCVVQLVTSAHGSRKSITAQFHLGAQIPRVLAIPDCRLPKLVWIPRKRPASCVGFVTDRAHHSPC